jgi:hypothetical protein
MALKFLHFSAADSFRWTLFLALLASGVSPAPFGLDVEVESGFKTNVPRISPASPGTAQQWPDSLYENFPFLSLTLGPALTFSKNDSGAYKADLNSEFNTYIGGPGEVSVEGRLSRERESARNSLSCGLGVAYYSLAAEYDPTVPQKYLEYAFHVTDKFKRRNPLTISYDLSVLQEIGGSRIDLKNALKLKLQTKIASRLSASVKTGCILDISNSAAGGFIQPLISGGAVYAPGESDMLLMQVYAAYPIYSNSDLFIVSKNKHKPMVPAVSIAQPRVPVSMLLLSYCRDLTPSLDINLNYDFTLLDPGGSGPIYSSNRLSISMHYGRGK